MSDWDLRSYVRHGKDSKQPDLDWADLVKLLDSLETTSSSMALASRNFGSQALHERKSRKAKEWIDRLTAAFGPFEGEPVEVKESDRKEAEEPPEQPSPLDIDTPTLKRCGSRFLFEDSSQAWNGIDLKTIKCITADSGTLEYYCRHEGECSIAMMVELDADVIAQAWLELGR